jgi:hypothetical protein
MVYNTNRAKVEPISISRLQTNGAFAFKDGEWRNIINSR